MDTAFLDLDRLSQQLLQVSEGNRKFPCVKISKKDRQRCDLRSGASRAALASVVKVEVEETAVINPLDNDEGLLGLATDLPPCHYKICLLCLRPSLSIHQLMDAARWESENELLQDIFQIMPNRKLKTITKQGVLCEQCFISVENLRVCYRKFKEAQNAYQETLLRIRCFRKCAQKITPVSLSKTYDEVDFDDNLKDFNDTEDTNDDLIKEPEPGPIIIRLSKKKIRTGNRSRRSKKKCTTTTSKKGKPIRRRGGLTEEEYQEHRRVQMVLYYERKKRMGKVGSKKKSSNVTPRRAEIKIESECSLESAPDSPISCAAIDSESVHDEDIDEHVEDNRKEVELVTPGEAAPLTEPDETGTKTTVHKEGKTKRKKKYNYKGKTIRRRGGLTEEEYQAHRRALGRQYYVKRRLKLGKMTYGPKPLGVLARKRLEKEEKLILDSNNLPARSNCGKALPTIQLEPGKRYSYRNIELIKEDDGTFRCGKCNHTAKAMNVLKKHITKNHFDREYGLKCSYCDRSFYYQYQLTYHENRHTERGAGVQCEECGQSFKHPTTYFAHRRIVHLGIKPHECQLCQKKFGTRKDLRKHTESKSHLAKVAENKTEDVNEIPATVWNSQYC